MSERGQSQGQPSGPSQNPSQRHTDVPGLVTYMAETLCDHKDQIEMSQHSRGRQRIIHLQVAAEDMGRLIGREGRVANAIRTLLAIVPSDSGRWRLEIANEGKVLAETVTEDGAPESA